MNTANQFICDLHAYEPGKPIEETARELGLNPDDILKLASNENPLGPSPAAVQAIQDLAPESHIYPDGGGYKLRTKIAETNNLDFDNIILGNGSNEIIELLCHSFLNPNTSLIAAEHAFVVYKLMATLFGAKYIDVPDPGFVHDLDAMADAITDHTRLLFIANPNNPTGTLVGQDDIDRFMARVPDHVITVFDEAYHEYLPTPPDTLKYVREGRNVVVMRTFSKAHGLAALRIGYGMAPAHLATILQKARQPFNTNAFAQAAALAALEDNSHADLSVSTNLAGLEQMHKALEERGLDYTPSHANFILVKVGEAEDAGDQIFNHMLKQGVIVRAMRAYKLPQYIRITIGNEAMNTRCLKALDAALATLI